MSYIIWIDEAWRGPWAWPVCAGAVLFLKWPKIRELKKQLDDSKRLSKIKRQAIFDQIVRAENSWFLVFGFWMATNVEIDNIWIKKANKLAMDRALKNIEEKIPIPKQLKILIDWKDWYIFPAYSSECESIVRWDSKIDEIKAASIIAKVKRDLLMEDMDKRYPWYNFNLNCWYWTKAHQDALKLIWICEIHRKSFKPIKNLLIL